MKKGFTLVELLAVIAILAILIILALPNVLGLFMSSKESAFVTEAQNVYKVAQEERLIDTMNGSGPVSYSSRGNELTNLNKSDLGYYVRFDSEGNVLHFIVYNIGYQIVAGSETNTEPILISDLCVSSGNCKYKAEQRSAYLLFPGTLSMNNIKKGDVDRSGSLDGDDLVALDEYLKGNLTLDDSNIYSADINSDGKVDNKDYTELDKHLKGQSSVLDNVVTYTVEHYQQKVTRYDDEHSYSMIETDQVEGISGKTSSPLTKNYEGFNTPSRENVTVSDDTVVKYYYNREKYNVKVKAGAMCSTISLYGTGEEIDFGGYSVADQEFASYACAYGGTSETNIINHDFLLGMNINVSTDDNVGFYINGELQGIKSFDFVMPAHDVTIEYKYLRNYTVNHYTQNESLTEYDLVETEQLYGEYNTNVTPAVKSYEGFTSPVTQTILLNENGKVVNYYYNRPFVEPTCENCVFETDGTNWELALLSSGSVTFHSNEIVDIFIVGAGGNSTKCGTGNTNNWYYTSGGAGGRGGGIKTENSISVTVNQAYYYTIGNTNHESSSININGVNYSTTGISGKNGGAAAYLHCGRRECNGATGGCGYFICEIAERAPGISGDGKAGATGVYAFGTSKSLYNSGVRYGNGGNGYHANGVYHSNSSIKPNTGDGAHGYWSSVYNGASGIIIIRNHR